MKTKLISLFICLAVVTGVYAQSTAQEADVFLSKQPDKVFLGGLIESESLNEADYRTVETTLSPITISCTLGGQSVTIQPSYENMMQAVREWVHAAAAKPHLEFTMLDRTMDSYAEASTFFGQHIDASAYFGVEKKSKRTLVAFLVSQSFFSVSMDLPEQLCTDAEVMKRADKLVYANTVEFGRSVLLTVESDSDEAAVRNALTQALNGKDLTAADKALLATATLRILIPGQEDMAFAHPASPLTDVAAYLNRPFGAEDFGRPFKFRASWLKDNSVFVNSYRF